MTVGKFVVLEGIECSGKGTIAAHVKQNWDMRCTREPGGTPFAEILRTLLISNDHPNVPPLAELYGFYSARVEHTANFIVPTLESGQNVFSERYYDSTRAYQAANYGGSELVDKVHEFSKPFLRKPDVTIYLDIPVEVCMQRMYKNRGKENLDKIEQRGVEYFETVRSNYFRNVDNSYMFVDATQSIESVLEAVDYILQSVGIQRYVDSRNRV